MYSEEVIAALAELRKANRAGADYLFRGEWVAKQVNILDNAGVFHEIDEQTHYDVYPT